MLVNGLLAVVMVGTMMLYFRLLGRLSWHGQEAAAEEASRDAGLGAKSAGAEPTPHSDSTSQLSE
jgi:hypothetical protein